MLGTHPMQWAGNTPHAACWEHTPCSVLGEHLMQCLGELTLYSVYLGRSPMQCFRTSADSVFWELTWCNVLAACLMQCFGSSPDGVFWEITRCNLFWEVIRCSALVSLPRQCAGNTVHHAVFWSLWKRKHDMEWSQAHPLVFQSEPLIYWYCQIYGVIESYRG